MAPSRFKKEVREKREVTPFADEPVAPPDIPAEWRDIEAPVNFTWVVQDELAGMGWPKSRDQVNFLIKQGIDHLITLAADKIPPHYAFPELKWTMIPVEDFTGPAIADIKKFIQIMAEARRDGEVKFSKDHECFFFVCRVFDSIAKLISLDNDFRHFSVYIFQWKVLGLVAFYVIQYVLKSQKCASFSSFFGHFWTASIYILFVRISLQKQFCAISVERRNK